MGSLMSHKTAILCSLLLIAFGVQAQQVTIDFSEFTENTGSPVTSRGYEIYGWGSYSYSWGENQLGVVAGPNPYFISEGAIDSCAGLCDAESDITKRFGQKGLGQRNLGRAIQLMMETSETNEGKCMYAEDIFKCMERIVLDYVPDSNDRAKYLDDLKISKVSILSPET